MGIFDDIKRLFFVNKSVAKSAGKKVVDNTRESVEDLKDEAAAAWEKAKSAGEHILNETSERINKVTDDMDLDAAVERAKAFTRKIQGDVHEENNIGDHDDPGTGDDAASDKAGKTITGEHDLEKTASEWLNRAAHKAEEIGSVAEEKFKSASEKIGEKALDLSDKLSEKARDVADRIEKKLDEISEKAEKLRREDDDAEHAGTHASTRHDENEELYRSTLEGSEGFFEKADRFASGSPMKDTTADKPGTDKDARKPEEVRKAYGFEDLDGDGNEIVDDAIIDEENE